MYEDIIHSDRKQLQKSEALADLITRMEQDFGIPALHDPEWEKDNTAVITVSNYLRESPILTDLKGVLESMPATISSRQLSKQLSPHKRMPKCINAFIERPVRMGKFERKKKMLSGITVADGNDSATVIYEALRHYVDRLPDCDLNVSVDGEGLHLAHATGTALLRHVAGLEDTPVRTLGDGGHAEQNGFRIAYPSRTRLVKTRLPYLIKPQIQSEPVRLSESLDQQATPRRRCYASIDN